MSRMVSPGTGRLFGLIRVCEIWAVSRATVYRQRRQAQLLPIARKRPGPIGAMADAELVLEIERLLKTSPFHGEGYRKVWARLRFEGIRTCASISCWPISVLAGRVARRPMTVPSRPSGSTRCGART